MLRRWVYDGHMTTTEHTADIYTLVLLAIIVLALIGQGTARYRRIRKADKRAQEAYDAAKARLR